MLFKELELHPKIQQGLDALGFEKPTPIQARSLPISLEGGDVIGSAATGSGKTLAFTLPAMHHILRRGEKGFGQVLVLVPTRELCMQVRDMVRDAGRFTGIGCTMIIGGASWNNQVDEIRQDPEIVVATPGRLLDHVRRGTFNLKSVKTLILDEADRMLDMGFMPDVRRIIDLCPRQRQTLLFSATIGSEIERLASFALDHPKYVEIQRDTKTADGIEQTVYPVHQFQKIALLEALLETSPPDHGIIFCRTRRNVDQVARRLEKKGFRVVVLHSDKTQAQRDKAMKDFREKKVNLLVATDVVSRGIDIDNLTHVINFDVPEYSEDYVHRVGRTARMDKTGHAITLVGTDERKFLAMIEEFIGKEIPKTKLDGFDYTIQPNLEATKKRSFADKFGKGRTGVVRRSRLR